ncbi:MAG: hypothetical protein NQ127_03850 [Candidatus Cardinium sp.]|nr:hypothetical protein [Candidatus Cardinium sp.]
MKLNFCSKWLLAIFFTACQSTKQQMFSNKEQVNFLGLELLPEELLKRIMSHLEDEEIEGVKKVNNGRLRELGLKYLWRRYGARNPYSITGAYVEKRIW